MLGLSKRRADLRAAVALTTAANADAQTREPPPMLRREGPADPFTVKGWSTGGLG